MIKESRNIFHDVLMSSSERAPQDTYFYRILGINEKLGETAYLNQVAEMNNKLLQTGVYFLFDRGIPVSTDSGLITKMKQLFEAITLPDFHNGRLASILEKYGYFSLTSDPTKNLQIKDSFIKILEIYAQNEPKISLSIGINFVTKLSLWFVEYGTLLKSKSPYNPKILYWGCPKIHEMYFLVLMSMIGYDVLVISTSSHDDFVKIDSRGQFSYSIKYQKEVPIGSFPVQKKATEPIQTITLTPHNLVSPSSYNPIIAVKLKKPDNILSNITSLLHQRSGYIGKPNPIIPTYFVRYIGLPNSNDDCESEYYNSLFVLDRSLQNLSYLKIVDGINSPTPKESSLIPSDIHNLVNKNCTEIAVAMIKANFLPKLNDPLLDETIKFVFKDIIQLFNNKNPTVPSSVILNFAIKIVLWLRRLIPELFKNFDYDRNPKILFYGNIKPHEVYLLYGLHKVGADVLFIHPHEDGDLPFKGFDTEEKLTTLIKNERNLDLGPFPQNERLVRKSTIAYNASKEIDEVIYGEDVGLFKPWQFENYQTQPITLRTTYDELKILWKEPSKVRAEFKVQNQKVYIPNLFAKVNGVHEELSNYWEDLKFLSQAPNTVLIKKLPLTQISYDKQELFQTAYLLNKDGYFDLQKVKDSVHYKFSYLKISLQNFIITKVNELISSKIFRENVDDKFKLKILMTVLKMDDSLVRLIESFDFPQEIPKLVIYDNTKESFSIDDAILLSYLNLIGFDIIIFSPTGYRTIEQYLVESFFETYPLSVVKFDLEFPSLDSIHRSAQKTGLFSKFFKI